MPEDARTTSAITAEIAAFAADLRDGGIPSSVIERGHVHMLDSLGLALAGAEAEATVLCRDHVAALGAQGTARVFGTAMRTAPRFAAFINGTAMHADNFDDTAPQASPTRNGGIHATAGVLPAALAVAEERGCDGAALSAAFHAGVEIACKLNHAVAQRHYMDGFHVTGTLGVFGAAVAAAKLYGMDAAGIARAIAGAASRAAGLRANFGFMVEQTHTGAAAESGIIAADLARRGLTGATGILETAAGWFDAAGGWEPAAICGRLGDPWAFDSPGTSIKPWPSGSLLHPAMTLLQDLIRRHGLTAADVARIRVQTNPRTLATLLHNRPTSALQAKFSMPFSLAVLLVEGRGGVDAYTDAMVGRADIRAVMERVDYSAFEAPGPGFTNYTTLLEIERSDGSVLTGRADFARGSSRAPTSFADVTEKFMGCAAHAGWPEAKTRAVVDIVADLKALRDVRALTQLLAHD